ncbi:hypothetical protein BH10BAC3_BH10BAC3_33560 [soil metagenome]
MAINKNHEFEELDGIKCAIVEKNTSAERVAFLKSILAFNLYTVVVVPSPQAKVAAVAALPVEGAVVPPAPVPPETFTIGVTDVTFNPINAIFGRILKAPQGHLVTQAYWQQKEKEPHEEVPYYEFGK